MTEPLTVIDVGCARYNGDFSVERLIEMFRPDVLYGFDPAQGQDEYPRQPHDPDAPTGPTKATRIVIAKKAAWTLDGEVGFSVDGLAGHIDEHGTPLPCIDLAKFIDQLPPGPIILKLDCEGAEYPLLEHLLDTNVDLRLTRLLVEWHPFVEKADHRRAKIERSLTCPVEEWRW